MDSGGPDIMRRFATGIEGKIELGFVGGVPAGDSNRTTAAQASNAEDP